MSYVFDSVRLLIQLSIVLGAGLFIGQHEPVATASAIRGTCKVIAIGLTLYYMVEQMLIQPVANALKHRRDS